MKHIYFSLALLLFAFTSCAQRDMSKVEIKATQVRGNIYMLEGAGGNMGLLIGEDGIVLIDDQFAPLSEKIRAAIGELSPGNVKYLVNTHFHGDHTGGNENFGKGGAIIVAHDNVRKRLSSESTRNGRTSPPKPEEAWPVITYEEGTNIHINDEAVMMVHVHDAHTDGDSFVYFQEANVLHMGDCFFNGNFPFIDLNSGGSVNGAIEAVKLALMMTNAETKIIPGHGSLATKADLDSYYTMLTTMRDRVQGAIDEGKTLDQAKSAGLTKDYESWGKGFISNDRIVETMYKSLKGE